MSITNARKFVGKMREDYDFRAKILETSGSEELSSWLDSEGLVFDKRELIEAMAECMQQLEAQICNC